MSAALLRMGIKAEMEKEVTKQVTKYELEEGRAESEKGRTESEEGRAESEKGLRFWRAAAALTCLCRLCCRYIASTAL